MGFERAWDGTEWVPVTGGINPHTHDFAASNHNHAGVAPDTRAAMVRLADTSINNTTALIGISATIWNHGLTVGSNRVTTDTAGYYWVACTYEVNNPYQVSTTADMRAIAYLRVSAVDRVVVRRTFPKHATPTGDAHSQGLTVSGMVYMAQDAYLDLEVYASWNSQWGNRGADQANNMSIALIGT